MAGMNPLGSITDVVTTIDINNGEDRQQFNQRANSTYDIDSSATATPDISSLSTKIDWRNNCTYNNAYTAVDVPASAISVPTQYKVKVSWDSQGGDDNGWRFNIIINGTEEWHNVTIDEAHQSYEIPYRASSDEALKVRVDGGDNGSGWSGSDIHVEAWIEADIDVQHVVNGVTKTP